MFYINYNLSMGKYIKMGIGLTIGFLIVSAFLSMIGILFYAVWLKFITS